MRSWEEVHRLREQENKSGREIARILGMSRNTVSRLLALPEPPRYLRSNRCKLDAYRATIISLLHKDPGLSAPAIRSRLVELGYEGGLTAVKEFVATVRAKMAGDAVGDHLMLEPDSEPGMNLISANFDIMMVNRVNERLFQKPMVELLGKKCYREFERRNEVCPHCLGVAALATGRPHQIESHGIRDDGTKYSVRLTAYPIMAPNGDPLGFVEVEEDITERKRSESLAELVEDLQTSLAAIHDITSAVRQALNVAFSLEGVDFGCAYVWDPTVSRYRAVAQRGVSRELAGIPTAEAILGAAPSAAPTRAGVAGRASVRAVGTRQAPVELVPVVHDGLTAGVLLLGSSTYAEFPPATHAAFEALSNIVGSAVASLEAVQLQRQTRADLESILGHLPLPIWCRDADGTITFWNRTAERVFGWSSAQVNRSDLRVDLAQTSEGSVVSCSAKDGTPVSVHMSSMPAPRALGPQRRVLSIAHHVTTSPRARPSGSRMKARTAGAQRPPAPDRPRVLLVESDPAEKRRLAGVLRDMGCDVTMCRDPDMAVLRYGAASRSARPFDLVVTELLSPAGMAGLELASTLHRSDPRARIVLTAESPVVGFESHGLAGALRKPFDPALVRHTIGALLAG